MTLEDLQRQVWLNASATVYNPDSAIYKKWKADKAGTALRGAPLIDEVQLDDGTRAIAFNSGQIAVWTPDATGVNVTVH